MKDKLDLIVRGAKSKSSRHRLAALLALRKTDKEQFEAHLIASIAALPRDSHDYYWCCPEAAVAALAVDCEDAQVWRALEEATERAAVGLRMEILAALSDPNDQRRRHERLRLLAHFLPDTTVRDQTADDDTHCPMPAPPGSLLPGPPMPRSKFGPPCAGSHYPKLEVQNFAAMRIARVVGLPVDEKAQRGAEEWAALRRQAHEAVKREVGDDGPAAEKPKFGWWLLTLAPFAEQVEFPSISDSRGHEAGESLLRQDLPESIPACSFWLLRRASHLPYQRLHGGIGP